MQSEKINLRQIKDREQSTRKAVANVVFHNGVIKWLKSLSFKGLTVVSLSSVIKRMKFNNVWKFQRRETTVFLLLFLLSLLPIMSINIYIISTEYLLYLSYYFSGTYI